MVFLSGPGVCVVLAVCQSDFGNGHRVIAPALTASSISLYQSCTPPSHIIFFHSLWQGAENKKKRQKKLSGRTPKNTTDIPERPINLA